jgi:hypothetical protein
MWNFVDTNFQLLGILDFFFFFFFLVLEFELKASYFQGKHFTTSHTLSPGFGIIELEMLSLL